MGGELSALSHLHRAAAALPYCVTPHRALRWCRRQQGLLHLHHYQPLLQILLFVSCVYSKHFILSKPLKFLAVGIKWFLTYSSNIVCKLHWSSNSKILYPPLPTMSHQTLSDVMIWVTGSGGAWWWCTSATTGIVLQHDYNLFKAACSFYTILLQSKDPDPGY